MIFGRRGNFARGSSRDCTAADREKKDCSHVNRKQAAHQKVACRDLRTKLRLRTRAAETTRQQEFRKSNQLRCLALAGGRLGLQTELCYGRVLEVYAASLDVT